MTRLLRLLWPAPFLCALCLGGCPCTDRVPDPPPHAAPPEAQPPPQAAPGAQSAAAPGLAQAPGTGPAPAPALRFEASQATESALAVTDGESTAGGDGQLEGPHIVFTLLGDLYRIAAAGGDATPLTGGPAYDTEPALSRDGRMVAFRSDRDGLPGIYLVPATGGDVRRLSTHPEYACGLPIFSVDARDVVYARHRPGAGAAPVTTSELVRQPVSGGAAQVLASAPGEISGMSFTREGRLIYAVAERQGAALKTGLFRFPERTPWLTLPGKVAALAAHPGGGVVARWQEDAEELVWLQPGVQKPQVLRHLQRTVSLPRIGWLKGPKQLVVSDEGRLRLLREDGSLAGEANFKARVDLPALERATEPARVGAVPGQPGLGPPRGPVALSGSGTLVYAAAGRIWLTLVSPAAGSAEPAAASPLSPAQELAYDPALSPDGKTLVYCRAAHSGAELLRVALPAAGERAAPPAVIFSALGLRAPAFTQDGKGVLVTVTEPSFHRQIYRVPVGAGAGGPVALPVRGGEDLQASPVPGGICYSGGAPLPGVLYRLQAGTAAGRPLTAPSAALRAGLCSPDGRTLAYVRDGAVFIAPLRPDRPITEAEGQRVALVAGGAPLSFSADGRLTVQTPDGLRVVPANAALSKEPAQGKPAGAGERPALIFPLQPPVGAAVPPPLWIRDVTLLDPEGQTVTPHTTIVIEGGRIHWVGPDAQAPPPPREARIIQGKRRFALPGLIDMHGQLDLADPRAYLAYGVTTVRTTGSSPHAQEFQAAGEAGSFPLPRIVITAELPPATAEAEVDRQVTRLREAGASLILLGPELPRPLRRAAAQAAAQRGLRVVMRATQVEDIVNAVLDGATLIDYAIAAGALHHDDLLQLLARAEVAVDSLLHPQGLAEHAQQGGYKTHNALLFELAVHKQVLAAHQGALRASGRGAVAAEGVERLAQQVVRERQAGVRVVAGTAAGTPGSFPGVSLAWELQLLGKAGLPPWQVLRAATVDAAQALSSPEIGRLVPDGRADLILLSGNPLENLHYLERVVLTVRGGQLYRPELLLIEQSKRRTPDIIE